MGLDLYLSFENVKAGIFVSLLSVWVLVGVFYYLNRYTRRRYFSVWTVAWLFYALWLTLNLTLLNDAGGYQAVLMLKHWCISIAATFLLWGSASFLGRRVRQSLLALFICFLFVWTGFATYQFDPTGRNYRLQIGLPIFILIGVASVFTGNGFYQYRRRREYLAAGLLAFGFTLWGLYLISYSFLETNRDLWTAGFFIAAVLQLFIAVSMIILVLEQVRFAHQRRALREISQQKREKNILRSQVRSTEERYQYLFHNSSEPMVVAAAQNLRIFEMNQAAERLLQLTNAEAMSFSLSAFCRFSPSSSPPKTGQEWFFRICEERPLQIVRRDGSVAPVEVKGACAEYDGQAAFQFSMREVTERSQLEEQLRQAEKLSALGQMISGVAHELQNPITGIKGFIELAMANDGIDSRTRSDLSRASAECDRVVRLSRNFLSLARDQSDQGELVDVNSLISVVLELRQFDLSVAGIECVTDLQPDLPVLIAKPEQIQQVLLNLINNAVQAISPLDRPGRIKVQTRASGGAVEIRVEDNGPGVPPQLQSRIFSPFFTTKPAGLGTGLGLSISHGIICDHGGRIYHEVPAGGGAAFVIELPVCHGPSANGSPSRAEAVSLAI